MRPNATAAQAGDRTHRAVERQFANHHKIFQLVGLKLLPGGDHADGDSNHFRLSGRPFLAYDSPECECEIL